MLRSFGYLIALAIPWKRWSMKDSLRKFFFPPFPALGHSVFTTYSSSYIWFHGWIILVRCFVKLQICYSYRFLHLDFWAITLCICCVYLQNVPIHTVFGYDTVDKVIVTAVPTASLLFFCTADGNQQEWKYAETQTPQTG